MADVCQISGTILDVDSAPKAGVQVRATIKSTQQDQGGQVAGAAGVTSSPITAVTGDDGTFTIQLLQGATVELEIPDIHLKKDVLVPAEDAVDFVALI